MSIPNERRAKLMRANSWVAIGLVVVAVLAIVDYLISQTTSFPAPLALVLVILVLIEVALYVVWRILRMRIRAA